MSDVKTSRAKPSTLIVGDCASYLWVCGESGAWEAMHGLPFECWYYAACASPRGFIVSGGWSDEQEVAHAACHEFVKEEGKWRALPHMHTARYRHGSIHHEGKIIVAGGWKAVDSPIDSVEMLDLESLQWSKLRRLPRALHSPYVVSACKKLFVISSEDDRSVYEYDSERRAWKEKRRMPDACYYGSALSVGEWIYVVGGKERRCMRYHVISDAWERLQTPLHEHLSGAAVLNGRKIVLCGGWRSDEIEEYDVDSDQWSLSKMKMPVKNLMQFAVYV